MTEQSLTDIAVGAISPSPFQHRRVFDDAGLRELAKSIEQDGLIQPITVRPHEGGYELIAGERRWRAVRQFTALKTIQARVLHVNDLQARRLCATENLQRADLTSLEEVLALAELVDASMLEFSGDYAPLSPVQEPKWRVKSLLMKLESVRKAIAKKETPSDELLAIRSKFAAETEKIFSGLPKPKDFITFASHDLPLLFTPAEVQEPKWRVKSVLSKLNSDRANKTNYFIPKFGDKIEEIFSGWRSCPTNLLDKLKPYFPVCQNQEEIAGAVEVPQQTIADWMKDFTEKLAADNSVKWPDFDPPITPPSCLNQGSAHTRAGAPLSTKFRGQLRHIPPHTHGSAASETGRHRPASFSYPSRHSSRFERTPQGQNSRFG